MCVHMKHTGRGDPGRCKVDARIDLKDREDFGRHVTVSFFQTINEITYPDGFCWDRFNN